MADILEALLAQTGRYAGSQTDPNDEHPGDGVGVVEVAALPGGTGVSFDYEVLHADGTRPHREHSLLVKTPAGLRMVVTHTHADVASFLAEEEGDPGYFTLLDAEQAPFPMAIRLEVPEPGRLVYSWSYGWTDRPMQVRDIGDLKKLD